MYHITQCGRQMRRCGCRGDYWLFGRFLAQTSVGICKFVFSVYLIPLVLSLPPLLLPPPIWLYVIISSRRRSSSSRLYHKTGMGDVSI